MKTIISQDALAAAQAFADFLAQKVSENNIVHIALSGGSTPKILFELLADEYDEDIDWEKLHFWWGDERCVPPTDNDSNYKMTKELLFDSISIKDSQIHRVLGENEPQEEANRYGEEILKHLPIVNGLPQFDIIMLGMGGDGHTASIFPHEMSLLEDKAICGVANHPESGQKRVTLNGPVINNAQDISFLVTGEGKTEKVDEIFNQKEGYLSYPAAHFNGENVVWYLDDSAARML